MRSVLRLLAIISLPLWLLGCAANSVQGGPRIERISAEELERLIPKPIPNLTLEQLVDLSRQGETPDAVIGKIRESQSGYVLTPSQMIELAGKGVSPVVLDYIQSAREQALRDGIADEINKRELACQEKLELLERQTMIWSYPCYGPYWGPYWGPYPRGYYRYWPRPY